jgi:hypothetical protein
MKYLAAALGLVMPLGAAPAAATDWYMVSETATASSASFVDKDSIRPSGGGLMQARIYLVFLENQSEGMAAIEALMEYDCGQPRSRFLRIATFDDSQRQLSDDPGSARWEPAAEGTAEGSTRTFICSNGQTPAVTPSLGAEFPFASARAHLARHREEDAQRK